MAEVPDRVDPWAMRASDADRERVAAVLRQAAAEGRLELAEVDERLGQVYAARTYAELAPLTRDLPGSGATPVPLIGVGAPATPDDRRPAPGQRASSGAVAVMSGFSRKGPWLVPSTFTCLAFWGGGEIDLRQARFSGPEVTIRAIAIMGGISVTVPEEAEVHVLGTGLMGGFDDSASGPGVPGAPRIVVTGFAFWGGVEVKRRPSDAEEKRRKLERKRRRIEGRSADE